MFVVLIPLLLFSQLQKDVFLYNKKKRSKILFYSRKDMRTDSIGEYLSCPTVVFWWRIRPGERDFDTNQLGRVENSF